MSVSEEELRKLKEESNVDSLKQELEKERCRRIELEQKINDALRSRLVVYIFFHILKGARYMHFESTKGDFSDSKSVFILYCVLQSFFCLKQAILLFPI